MAKISYKNSLCTRVRIFSTFLVIIFNQIIVPQPANSSWPMYGYDFSHTGQTNVTGPHIPYIEWSYDFGNTAGGNSAVIGIDGTIFYQKGSTVFAFNPDGSIKWSYTPFGQPIASSSAAVDINGNTYFGSQSGNLYSFDSDGNLNWTFDIGGDPKSSNPTIGSDGTIYIGSPDSNLYAINSDGTLKWKFNAAATITTTPAVSLDGTIYFTTEYSSVYQRSLIALYSNGTIKWRFDGLSNFLTSPTVSPNGTVYFGTADGILYSIYPWGSLKWEFQTGTLWSSPVIGEDGIIYVGSMNGEFFAISSNGQLNWQITLPSGTSSGVASLPSLDKEGIIYVAQYNGNINAINPDGSIKWSFQLPGETSKSSPVIGPNGSLYIGSFDPHLYAIGDSINTLINGYVKYGSTPINNIQSNLYTIENGLLNHYAYDLSDNDGYYMFQNINEGNYRLIPSLYQTPYWSYRIYNQMGRLAMGEINVSSHSIFIRDIKLFRRLYLINPSNLFEQYPLEVEWLSVPNASHYRIVLLKSSGTGLYPVFDDYTDELTYTIPDLNETGYFYILVTALDADNLRLAETSFNFYLTNNQSIVTGDINSNTVWEGFILIKSNIHIAENATLTIKPNTIVFFDTTDISGISNRFQISVDGKILAVGEPGDGIIITSYPTQTYSTNYNWDGINIFNNGNSSIFSNVRFTEANNALKIINSDVNIDHTTFGRNDIGLYLEDVAMDISNSVFYTGWTKHSNIQIKDLCTISFTYCTFYNTFFHPDGEYMIELINAPLDVYLNHCYWVFKDLINEHIYDYEDNNQLGKVISGTIFDDPLNLSIGGETANVKPLGENNKYIIQKRISATTDPMYLTNVLGEPDQNSFFLNSGNNLIVDMGVNGEIINEDTTDLVIISNFYKNRDTLNILVDLSLSDDTLGTWESLGMLTDSTMYDISELNGSKFRFVRLRNFSSSYSSEDSIGIFIDAIISLNDSLLISGIDADQNIDLFPTNYELGDNFPNPFNPRTRIKYSIPQSSNVVIKVYDILGNEIETLVNEEKITGTYEITWNAENLPSGVYFYRIQAGSFIDTKKMILLK